MWLNPTSSEPTHDTQVATLAFIGDLVFGHRTSAAGPTSAPEHVWGDVMPYLRGSDAVFVNLESPITTTSQRWRRGWKAIRLHAAPSVGALLKAANVRFVNLANNHAMDCEVDGQLDTIKHLHAAGISHAGAGRNAAEAAKPAILEAGGIKIGVLSITDNMREFAAGPTQSGTNYLRIHSDKSTLDYIGRQIDQIRAAGTKLVVLSAHWGPNLRQWPTTGSRQFAHAMLDCGVDIVHAHSAHFVQGPDLHRSRVVLYDSGDFLDDLWLFRFVPRYLSCMFLIDFDGGTLQRVRVIPVILEPGRVRLGYGHSARRILARVFRRSPPGLGHSDAAAAVLFLVPYAAAANVATATGQEVLAIR